MLKTAGLVAGNTVGKLLGVAREILLAYFFGAGAVADAYRIGLSAALVPTHFFMGDVLDGAFVPLYVRHRLSDPARAWRFLRATTLYLTVVSLVIMIALSLAGERFVRLLAPGLRPETVELASAMLRLMALGIPFYCLGALLSLVGLSHDRYRVLALRPMFLNAGLILVLPLAYALKRPALLGAGFAVAFACYFVVAVWSLSELLRRPAAAAAAPGGHELRELFTTALPLLSIMVMGQLLAVVDRAAASFAGPGAIAALDYARVFTETPHVLIGTALASTALARFSALPGEQVAQVAEELLLPLLSAVVALMLVVIASAPDLVHVAYQRGRFDAEATVKVTLALRGLAIGAPFMMASYVMNRVLSARLRNREAIAPMVAAVATAGVANALLVRPLGLFGVGLSMSLAYLVLCGLLAWRLRLLGAVGRRVAGWVLAAAAVAALVRLLPAWRLPALVHLAGVAGAAGIVAVGGLSLWGATRDDLRSLVGRAGTLLGHLGGEGKRHG